MEYLVTDIIYDTDGQIVDLPKEMKIIVPIYMEDPYDIDEYISDEISNRTGFCHKGFSVTPELYY